jgi:hypothetical protein
MITNPYTAKDFCTGADINMAADNGYSRNSTHAYCHLLENQTIGTYLGVWMNNDAIRMCHYEPATQGGVQGNIRPAHATPETMLQNEKRK